MGNQLRFLDKFLKQNPLVVIDGGARNGTYELPHLAPYVHVYGFEPNQAEYQKLISGNTDVFDVTGIKPPAYAKITFLPTALAHVSGRRPLYITEGPGSCSLMEPNEELTRQYDKNWIPAFAVKNSLEVECSTLEQVLRQYEVDWVDYIKLDTQGNEFEILFASEWALNRLSVIKTEVEFIEMYRRQHLFWELDAQLRKSGFHFIDLVTSPDHRKGRGYLSSKGRRELIWGDAYYARQISAEEYRSQPIRALKQALILMELGYLDYGLYVLGHVAGDELPLDDIRTYYQSDRKSWKDRIPVPIKTFVRNSLRTAQRKWKG